MSALAKKLIAENIAKRERGEDATTLDLGRCGLTDLAQQVPELFDLVWLEELTLSNEWWDAEKGAWQESQNKGTENHLSEIPPAFARLSALRTLRMGGNVFSPWGISDLRFLEKLTGLTSLDLGGNQISDLRGLEKLTGLTSLHLEQSNQRHPFFGKAPRFLEKLTGLTLLTSVPIKVTSAVWKSSAG